MFKAQYITDTIVASNTNGTKPVIGLYFLSPLDFSPSACSALLASFFTFYFLLPCCLFCFKSVSLIVLLEH